MGTSMTASEGNLLIGYTVGVCIFTILPLVFSFGNTVNYFHLHWCSILQALVLYCSLRAVCKLIWIIIATVLLPFGFILMWTVIFMCPTTLFNCFFICDIIQKWSLCSEDGKTNAYNAKLFEYITRDNKYYNFKQAKKKIIAVNYYILSVIKDKINNYPDTQLVKDDNFLQKVLVLHEQSRLNYTNDNTKYLWNVDLGYFREQRCVRRAWLIFIRFLYFVPYAFVIGLIVYAYCIHYDRIIFLILFFLLELINIIFIILHRRIWFLAVILLPNVDPYSNNVQNRKVDLIWNALDVTENEMIKRIEIIYNIMFVRSMSYKTLYKIDTFDSDIKSVIAEFSWFPLPYSFETVHKSIDMNTKYAKLSSTEIIQNKEIDSDYLSFIFNDESESDDDDTNIEDKRLIGSDEDELKIHFTETML